MCNPSAPGSCFTTPLLMSRRLGWYQLVPQVRIAQDLTTCVPGHRHRPGPAYPPCLDLRDRRLQAVVLGQQHPAEIHPCRLPVVVHGGVQEVVPRGVSSARFGLDQPGHAHVGGAPWQSMPRAVISAVITSGVNPRRDYLCPASAVVNTAGQLCRDFRRLNCPQLHLVLQPGPGALAVVAGEVIYYPVVPVSGGTR
jgi:hypothetical protein